MMKPTKMRRRFSLKKMSLKNNNSVEFEQKAMNHSQYLNESLLQMTLRELKVEHERFEK